MKRVFLILSFLLFVLFPFQMSAQAQDQRAMKMKFERAYMMTLDQLYVDALPLWKELLEERPDNASLNYFAGICYFNSADSKFKGIAYFEKARQKTTQQFEPFYSSDEAPIDVHFYLGKLYHMKYRFKEALQELKTFEEKASKDDPFMKDIDRHIAMSEKAIELIDDPLYAKISNLGPQVNSPYSDYCPVLSLDETSLFFTSRRLREDSSNYNDIEGATGKYFEDIYVSYKQENGEWGEAELFPLSRTKNEEGGFWSNFLGLGNDKMQEHIATSNLSSDGKTLFIYKTVEGAGNLYQTTLEDGNWSRPELLAENINSSGAYESHIDISADGRDIYFVSDREGGFGGKDIYGIKKLPNGEWSQVYNLGPEINTPFDEDGPFIHPNQTTLYFSSEGHETMGGFDIFSTELTEEGNWSEPHNIGYPINTPDDDVYFVVSPDGKRAYYSADFKGVKKNVGNVKGYGEEDLYQVEFPGVTEKKLTVLKGIVRAKACQEKLDEVTVHLVNKLRNDTLEAFVPRSRDGGFVSILPPGQEYILSYAVEDRILYKETIDVPKNATYREVKRAINLDTLDIECADGELVSANKPAVDVDAQMEAIPEQDVEPMGLLETTTRRRIQRKKQMTQAMKGKPDVRVDTVTRVDTVYIEKEGTGGLAGQVVFEKYFDYNKKMIATQKDDLASFSQDLKEVLQKNKGTIGLRIEASASKVPTATYGSNFRLAIKRAEEAQRTIRRTLRDAGLDPSRVEINMDAKVQGPEYQGDPDDKEKYGEYQYVKIFLN